MRKCCFIFLLLLLPYFLLAQYDWSSFPATQQPSDSFGLQPLLVAREHSEMLKSDKVILLRLLKDGDAIVRLKSAGLTDQLTEKNALQNISAAWKLTPTLRQMPDTTTVSCLVRDKKAFEWQQGSLAQGIQAEYLGDHLLKLTGNTRLIKAFLLSRTSVTYAGVEALSPGTESRILDLDLTQNHINALQSAFPHLNGRNISLSVKELQFDTKDLDLLERSIPSPLSSGRIDQHATDVATVIAGAGNSSVMGRGVAPLAMLSSSTFEKLPADPLNSFRDWPIFLQNHSYGTRIENFYGALAASYDELCEAAPELLHVFSAGNSGQQQDTVNTTVQVPGYYNLTGNFKMAKNILTVGAVDTVGQALFFSSRGPAFDGRVKPELTAFSLSGTSNAAALVSGTIALLQQAYTKKYGVYPSSALIRGLLINTADEAGRAGIDFATGYGSLNAYRAMKNLLAENYFSGQVSEKSSHSFDLEILENTAELKLTLSWLDPAVPPGSAAALLNDLDLLLITPSGDTLLPWVLDAAPNIEALNKPAFRGRDSLNNQELITLSRPTAGIYLVQVKGTKLFSESQDFFVNYLAEEEERLLWLYPVAEDNVPFNGETYSYFQWHSTFSGATGQLEYTTDEGQTWNIIHPAIDLQRGFYRWTAPDTVVQARARMIIDGQIFNTERFVISRPLNVRSGFNCEENALINWNDLEHVGQYEIFNLLDTFMEPLAVERDTIFFFSKNEVAAPFFSVAPQLPSGLSGLRSATINIEQQGIGCYILSFFADTPSDAGVRLNLSLGSIFGIREVVFEREVDGKFTAMEQVGPEAANVAFLDTSPRQGLNRYRARIILDDGTIILSAVSETFFFNQPPFTLFPNPNSNGILSIFTNPAEDLQYTFELFDALGRKVRENILTSDRSVVFLRELAAGLYFYRITIEEGYYEGKLLLN